MCMLQSYKVCPGLTAGKIVFLQHNDYVALTHNTGFPRKGRAEEVRRKTGKK